MSFPNLYYKRAVGTERACFVCYKPTTTCLATIDSADFLYACTTHLSDRGFATQVLESPPPQKAGASQEEIDRVKKEWEEKQKQKREREKEKEKEQDKGKDGEAKGDQDKDKDSKDKSANKSEDKIPVSTTPAPIASPSLPKKPTHEKYTLHRDIFALRVAEHRKRRQTAQAKNLAPRLPGAPRSNFS
ncbi:DUF1742-domain-containing protein [Coniophora puteana RWD-64-598 SS2]|uniref:DUF1742-domain-containing protein n=1 Tax=Coniophora puteana (strain RWD-64-598) TaxID=741705 RepID=A0A5M3MTU4_CONPW|nr:DUF1742-domain-containing protein [Coniophora puteana RWD-64-598 SS2]EIW82516.1 DUF1742-domain-containing protein [Coniophora puteana RWD-64-598 SS2]